MKTLRETKSGDVTLRLVQTANDFVGLAIKGSEIKAREDGADADDVWRRIHDAAARLKPAVYRLFQRSRALCTFSPRASRVRPMARWSAATNARQKNAGGLRAARRRDRGRQPQRGGVLVFGNEPA